MIRLAWEVRNLQMSSSYRVRGYIPPAHTACQSANALSTDVRTNSHQKTLVGRFTRGAQGRVCILERNERLPLFAQPNHQRALPFLANDKQRLVDEPPVVRGSSSVLGVLVQLEDEVVGRISRFNPNGVSIVSDESIRFGQIVCN